MISIVTPVYNEEGNVVYFHDEVTKVMKGVDMDYEIIYVNDGSKDRTDELIHQLADSDPSCGRSRLLGISDIRSPLPAVWILPSGMQ